MKKFALDVNISVLTLADRSPLFKKVEADTESIVALADALPLSESNVYVAGDPALEALPAVGDIERRVFAELPVQAGWCYGCGRKMNGVEWHKSSEVVVAATDCVLILGDVRDIEEDTYDSSRSVALALERGEAAELFSGTLHLAPLAVGERFAVSIILPKGTNAPLAGGIDGTLRAVNKWLLVHEDNAAGIAAGGKVGVTGANIAVLSCNEDK